MIADTTSMTRPEKVLTAICAANFIVFVLVAVVIGGDAINGHIADGRYFLAMNGRVTETTASVFSYSRWHAFATIMLFVFVLVLRGVKTLSKRAQRVGSA